MPTQQELLTVANTVSAARAFTYAGNFGRGEFTHAIKVRPVVKSDINGLPVQTDKISLHSACDAQVPEKRALAELVATVAAVREAFPGTKRSAKITRTGFWHMGRFCTDGFRVEMWG